MEAPPTPEILSERLKLVSEIARELLAAKKPSEITRTVFERLAQHLGLEVYFNYLVTPDGTALRLGSCAGVPEARLSDVELIDFDGTLCGAACATRVPIVAEKVQGSEDPRTALLRSFGILAYTCFPLLANGDVMGTLSFGTRRRSRFESHELELLRTVSDQVALALERERLLRTLEDETIERRRAEEAVQRQALREQAARAEAEEANRAKDEFLAVLSHELRTPLNVMLGWIKMLRSGGFDEAQTAHALEVVERNIEAQTDLINELLDVSRIVSGKLSLDMRPLDLVQVVRAAIDAVSPSAETKGIRLRTGLDGGPLRAVGDATRLQQVALNLLTNAVKFTPAGGVITTRLEGCGDRARLVVSDTGEGIAAELLPHIFERHRQRDSRSTRAHGGLGLGLTIVRRLVEMHGGRVDAASAGPRKGATFTVELPLSRSTRPVRPSAPATSARTAEQRLDLVRVLVVDDHADSRELLSVMLKERGAAVATAASVAEAYRLLGTFRPDIVLCDISMPGEDGFRLLEWVQAAERRSARGTPVIAVTAHARIEDRQRVLAAGFKAHLPKPLEPEDVVRAIHDSVPRPVGPAQ